MLSLGILGSGKGSNFQAILDAINHGVLDARVACVISDVERATILDRAQEHDLPAHYIDHAPFKSKLDGEAEQRVIACLQDHGADFIALAGYMRMVKSGMLEAFPDRIVNIHPSILPAFPGLAAWEQALAYGAKVAGCTVHFLDTGMDTGPIITQRVVPVLDKDTPAELHARIQEQEHLAYPEALQWIASDRIRLEGHRVVVYHD